MAGYVAHIATVDGGVRIETFLAKDHEAAYWHARDVVKRHERLVAVFRRDYVA